MTQTMLAFEPETATGRVAQLFRSKPNQDISAIELAKAGGFLAWRSRVSDARREYHMTITPRLVRVNGKVVESFYRWIP